MKINKIFLDLDGVLRDWCGGIFKLFKCKPIEVTSWNAIVNYVCKEYGISKDYFWSMPSEYFWEELKPYSWMHDILDLLPTNKTCILTSPTLNSAMGTQKWICKNLPSFFYGRQYLIGPAKHFCASKDALLIDDSGRNTGKFRETGGQSILFPQPWNNNRNLVDERVNFLKMRLNVYNI